MVLLCGACNKKMFTQFAFVENYEINFFYLKSDKTSIGRKYISKAFKKKKKKILEINCAKKNKQNNDLLTEVF